MGTKMATAKEKERDLAFGRAHSTLKVGVHDFPSQDGVTRAHD